MGRRRVLPVSAARAPGGLAVPGPGWGTLEETRAGGRALRGAGPETAPALPQCDLLLTPPCSSTGSFLCLEGGFFLLPGPNTRPCPEVRVDCRLPCATRLQPLWELSRLSSPLASVTHRTRRTILTGEEGGGGAERWSPQLLGTGGRATRVSVCVRVCVDTQRRECVGARMDSVRACPGERLRALCALA